MLSIKSRLRVFFFISVVLFFFAFILGVFFKSTTYFSFKVKKFENSLHKKEVLLKNIFSEVSENVSVDSTLFSTLSPYQQILDENALSLFVYKNQDLKYWSNNTTSPIPPIKFSSSLKDTLVHLDNGWYLIKFFPTRQFNIIGCILVKHDYHYQNNYLKNIFAKGFSLPSNINISTNKGNHNILSQAGDFVFSLQISDFPLSSSQEKILFCLYFLGLLFLIYSLFFLYNLISPFNNTLYTALTFSADLLILRFVLYYFNIPHILQSTPLFSDLHLSLPFFNSIGDILLNAIFILSVSLICYKPMIEYIKFKKRFILLAFAIIFSSLLYLYFGVTIAILKSLILNTPIYLRLDDIYFINSTSVIICFSLACFFASLILFCNVLVQVLFANSNKKNILYFAIGLSLFHVLMITHTIHIYNYFYFILFALLIFVCFIFSLKQKPLYWGISVISFVILFSLFSSYTINSFYKIKDQKDLKQISIKLSSFQDNRVEAAISSINNSLIKDRYFSLLISESSNDSVITNYLFKKYFNEHFSRYKIQITRCKEDQTLIIKPNDINVNCVSFFNDIILHYGASTQYSDLFLISDNAGSYNYLLALALSNQHIFIEFFPKNISKGVGYPELLVDKGSNGIVSLSNISYAIYKNNELTKSAGKYSYGLRYVNCLPKDTASFKFQIFDHYLHLFYSQKNNTTIIVSKKQSGLFDLIAPFSYSLLFFSTFSIILLLIVFFPNYKHIIDLNFKTRLQLYLILIIIISFILIGTLSLLYLSSLNKEKNASILNEKAHSILIEMEHKYAGYDALSTSMNEPIQDILTKFSQVFFSDINIFLPNGQLLASSRPQVFEEGLMLNRINSNAYYQLAILNKSLLIQKEQIGDYSFLSAYIPLFNNQNTLIAYINLPYFAKQDEMQKEISTFATAFINIYLLLSLLAILAAILISNYITKPLQFIKNKMREIILGNRNEKIPWSRNDEIGSLIAEYNKMIDELARSAEMLAKSERESAWREMAKQVAHEIKNPLTPIKLSAQHLQKAWDDKSPDWDQRLSRFTQTLIEQIDILSSIASEFSDFAQMPHAKDEPVDLSEILNRITTLYKDTEAVAINIDVKNHPCIVSADRKQLLRVFHNLVKNAIQAVNDQTSGVINISVYNENENYIVKIADNGNGIPKEQIEKIFSPNFTTKSSGMGLGLAIAKNIIDNAGGRIWFETEIGKGTRFFVAIKKSN